MSDPTFKRKTASGTIKAECPRCLDLAGRAEDGSLIVIPECELCGGSGEVGMSLAVDWILRHGKTDPPP